LVIITSLTDNPLKRAFFFLLASISFYHYSYCQRQSSANAIDARFWSGDSSFPIAGSCYFFDGQLLTPEECGKATGDVVTFPALWTAKQENAASLGYATYSLLILLKHDHQKNLALTLPQMYSSYRLWANGQLTAENGSVGKSQKESIPQWRPQTVLVEVTGDSLNLILQIANFHHAKGGVKEPIYLGLASRMQFKRKVAAFSTLTETIVLFLVSASFFFIYFRGTRKTVTLYFALLCLTWSVRSLFSNLYLGISYFPDFDWTLMVRIEYITLYLTMIWAILFLSQIFQFEANIFFKYALVFCNLIFTVFTLFSSPLSFTKWLNIYLLASAVLLLYGGFTVVRAWVNERVGSGLLTISIILGLNIFAYDIFVYEGFSSYDPLIFSSGYITIFMLLGGALSMHLGLIKSKPSPSTRLTYDDLYKKE
jgi:hypothetical protein